MASEHESSVAWREKLRIQPGGHERADLHAEMPPGIVITTYENIAKVYVRKGQKVKSKQSIGEIFTHPQSGKTTLQFSVFNELKPQNPKNWIYKL